MVRAGAGGPVDGVEFEGADRARPTREVLEAISAARAIVIGPSNPVISIGPILALPGMREALEAATAPVVGISPFVGGSALKGPTHLFMRWARQEPSADGVAAIYEGLIDGLVADERTDRVPVLQTDTLLADPRGRRRVAEETLRFVDALTG
jgi:LPPG:FO 2-phospho-L-lactate transferase